MAADQGGGEALNSARTQGTRQMLQEKRVSEEFVHNLLSLPFPKAFAA